MVSPSHFISDRLGKMGFSQSYSTINNQRIEGIGAGLLGNRLSGTAGYPVTITFNKCIECIYRVQLCSRSASSSARVSQMDSLPDYL